MISSINAASSYSSARTAIAPQTGNAENVVMRIGDAAEAFSQQVQQVDKVATSAMTGTADTHQLVQTIAETKLAVETVTSIRDKVVEAYQEILRMPV